MPDGPQRGPQDVQGAIEAYVLRHPHAADSLEGIASWWLGGEWSGVPIAQVEAAVNELCRLGVLQADSRVSGVVVYRRVGSGQEFEER